MMSDEGKEPVPGYTEAMGEAASNPSEPRTSGDKLFVLGREWTIAPLENRICAQFEQMVRSRAKLAIREAERDDGPEEANAMRSAYAADLGAGHYNWDGRYCRSARGDWPGLRYLIFLLLRRCHPNVTEDQVAAMLKEDARGCGLALAWALGRMGQEISPNAQAPKAQRETMGENGEKAKTMTRAEWEALGKLEVQEARAQERREKGQVRPTPVTMED